jgi:signal transduction histidine kinase
LIADVRREREVQRRTLEEVTQIIAQAATKAVYEIDSSLASDVLKGLLSYQPIFRARIQNEFGVRLAVRERPLVETRLRLFSEWLFGQPLEILVPLYHEPINRPRVEIGTLRAAVDSHIVATAFLERARSTLISGLLRNLLLGLVLTAIFHYMVTKPILTISRDFTRIDPQSPGAHLVEAPYSHETDELGLLVNRTNNFLQSFEASLRERAHYAEELRGALLRAEEGSRAKSQFLATMSHELRTPLNAIIGFSELIRDDPDANGKSAALGEYAREIHSGGSQLLQIINDLLDLTEIDAGHHVLNPEPLDIRHLLEGCARQYAAIARERKLRLSVEVDPTCGPLCADHKVLRQIIINVLSNALKFTPADGWVTLSGAASSTGTVTVLTVADSGIGIDPVVLARVCEPFWQADPMLSRHYGGTGLGMPLVQALVDLHDGDLRIQSTLGEGTVVTIEIPNRAETAERELQQT